MPWNDIQCKVAGPTARDVAINFIQRWNLAIRSGKNALTLKVNDTFQNEVLPYSNCTAQVVRSASKWSFGVQIPERSIYEAYLELIDKSEHYIYIENQFFISASDGSQVNPQNRVVSALIARLKKAIERKKKFKLIVMLPLQPSTPIQSTSTLIIIYWQYTTIFRGEHSIFSILQKEFPKVDLNEYIFFCSMRNYGFSPKDPETPVSEMVYIHSKMMIVDDKYSLIGSANINDRSLHGSRDSEIALIIEDNNMLESKMNEKKFMVGKFSHELRMKCWMKYLGRNSMEGLTFLLF
jgi:phospholipase D1/2